MYKLLVYTLGASCHNQHWDICGWIATSLFWQKKVLVMELFEKFKQFRDSFLDVSNWVVKRKRTRIKMHSYYNTK
jgi:hypothetical protein